MSRLMARTTAAVPARAVAVLVSAIALGAGAEARASGGSIVFTHAHNIWLTSPDGATKRPLTTDGTAATPYHSPSQSADGSVVVAVRDVTGAGGAVISSLFEMDRQGTLLRVPFAPAQYELVNNTTTCPGGTYFVIPTGIEAVVSPDASKIAVDKLHTYSFQNFCGTTGSGGGSEVYVINLDGSLVDDDIASDPGTAPLSLVQPTWVTNSRLMLYANLPDGIAYHDHGSPRAATWIRRSGSEPTHEYPALSASGTTLATTGEGLNIAMDLFSPFADRLRLWTMNGPIPAAPTPRCDIISPAALTDDGPSFAVTELTMAPDGGGVAWVEEDRDAFGRPTATSIYSSPVGDLSAGSCSSLGRELLSRGGDEPSWGAAPVGPPGSATTLPVCPAAHPGVPPACDTATTSCPPGQLGSPPDCRTAPVDAPAGRTQTPAPPPPPPRTAPPAPVAAITALRMSPTRLRAARSGPPALAAAARTGARVSYALTVAASVRFGIERATRGRNVNGRCVKPGAGNRKRPPCTRFLPLAGTFTRTRPAGTDAFRFTGRIGGRALRPGRYRLIAIAIATANRARSAPARAAFSVVR